MANELPPKVKAEIARQLNNKIPQRTIAENLSVSRSSVQSVSDDLKKLKKTTACVATVLEDTKKGLTESGLFDYDIEKQNAILSKAVKITDTQDEIDRIIGNGGVGLLKANAIVSDAVSRQVLSQLERGCALDPDEVAKMVAINNNAFKLGFDLKEYNKDIILKEEEQEQLKAEQGTLDLYGMDDKQAAKEYLEIIKKA